MKLISLLTIFYFTGLTVMAQSNASDTTSDSTPPDTRTQFIAGVTYNSALNYYGRTDSLKSKGIYPFVGINFKNGLYVNSSFVFINNNIYTVYAATIVEGGYQFRNKSENWSGNIFANTFFYQNNGLVQSALKGSAGINLSNLNKIININVGGDMKLSDKIDYGGSVGFDRTIRIEELGKGVMVIDPSAYLYAGTQNFTKTYYQKKNVLFLPAGEELVTTSSKKFNILSYEFSMPVVYALGKMNIILSPAYVLPQNLISAPERQDLTEKGGNLFYVTITMKFTF